LEARGSPTWNFPGGLDSREDANIPATLFGKNLLHDKLQHDRQYGMKRRSKNGRANLAEPYATGV
jgi:hypothetical protein